MRNLLRRYMIMVDAAKRRFARAIVRIAAAVCGAAYKLNINRIEGNGRMTELLTAILRDSGINASVSLNADCAVDLTAVIDTSGNVIEGRINSVHSSSGDMVKAYTFDLQTIPTAFDVASGAFAARCDVHNADAPDIVIHVVTSGYAVDHQLNYASGSVPVTTHVSALISECKESIRGLNTFVYLMDMAGSAAPAAFSGIETTMYSIADNAAKLTLSENKPAIGTACSDNSTAGVLTNSINAVSGDTGGIFALSGTLSVADPWVYPEVIGDNDEGLLIAQVYSAAEITGGGLSIE